MASTPCHYLKDTDANYENKNEHNMPLSSDNINNMIRNTTTEIITQLPDISPKEASEKYNNTALNNFCQ